MYNYVYAMVPHTVAKLKKKNWLQLIPPWFGVSYKVLVWETTSTCIYVCMYGNTIYYWGGDNNTGKVYPESMIHVRWWIWE